MTTSNDHYYVPEGSQWPIITAVSIFVMLFGLVLWINTVTGGSLIFGLGALGIAYIFYGWFSDVIGESRSGTYNAQVDASFRQGMVWFIASEVFFFAAFFGSLFYIRNVAIPSLGGEGHLPQSHLLWDSFVATWPVIQMPDGTNFTQPKEAMGAMGIPLINTIILLTSGVTVTIAHWGLKAGKRGQLVGGLAATVLLGFLFVGFQAYEYYHAYHAMDLTLNSGIYGSMFYMLTGFHGFHVTLGAIMLLVIMMRCMKGHFSHEDHFGFEAVSWYWHFVDVVWLGLYIFVYWM